ncbi:MULTISPECIES: hypothetical protein [Pontibacillus]|uniref:Holin n=1 Tax=Pontibacillus chungwhensis TaxID=265426 RepID=A0ABY8UZX9_9BACI|nr:MULTISPECIES: hypothetical protein [Pontibacillus]MCD5324467.1 hypothetical protein [Pontibacillus sp. HN14]WIF99240.1 hypothetical protein QNI29_06150 [Pontibacillus chungwhensis]
MRDKVFFGIGFILLLPITTSIYKWIYYHFPWNGNDVVDILTVLLYLAGILPLTAYLSNEVVKSYINNRKRV